MTVIRSLTLLAALAFINATPASARPRPGVGLGQAFPQACASGYHPDAGGNCQPNGGAGNRYCPDGLVFQPTFDGWTCDPPPPEAY
jgi:hypothetical protein